VVGQKLKMSLFNDHYFQVLTDQRERELARLAERNWHVRLALSGRGELVGQVAGAASAPARRTVK
jgi:hypothetical protein